MAEAERRKKSLIFSTFIITAAPPQRPHSLHSSLCSIRKRSPLDSVATNPAVRQQEGFLTFIFAVCTTALVQNFAQTLQYDPCDSPAARELQSSSRTNEGAFFDFTGQCVDFLN